MNKHPFLIENYQTQLRIIAENMVKDGVTCDVIARVLIETAKDLEILGYAKKWLETFTPGNPCQDMP